MKAIDVLKEYKEGKLSTADFRKKLDELKGNEATESPLSEGQKGLWMLEKVSPGMSAYNLPLCFKIYNKVNIDLFKEALNHIIESYPILKTVIKEKKGVPYQTVEHGQKLYCREEDISPLKEEEVIPYLKELASKSFSLSEGPLMRVYLLKRAEQEYIVLLNVHHIIFDGSSITTVLTTLLDSYLELLKGKKPEKKKSSSDYYDFVNWEREMLAGPGGEEHRSYWKEQLSGELPVLELPTDYPRHSAKEFKGETFRFSIEGELKKRIDSFCQEQRVSLPTFFLANLKLLLHQYSKQDDIIVGMAGLGRADERFESQVGYFINMIPIRSKIGEEQSFSSFLKELQLSMLDGMDHGEYPFPVIVRELNLPRNMSNSPVFQVGYFYQNFIQSDSLSALNNYRNSLHIELMEEIHQEGEYELALEVFEQKDGFLLNVKYNPELYTTDSIKRVGDNLTRLTTEVVKQPELAIKEYSLISVEEERELLVNRNATERDYPRDKCVQELFKEQVKRSPDAIAVVYEGKSLTYSELDEKSEKLAIYLQKQGVGPEKLVGISVERSLYMIIGLLGILKAGGAYVPLDPDYPVERLEYMVQNSELSTVLTQSSLMSKMDSLLGGEAKAIPLDSDWEKIEQVVQGESRLIKEVGPGNLAYVIYTSGSTGNPKGVMIPHAALTNFLVTMGDKPGLTAKDKLFAVTTFCFDIAGLELYLPLINGAECYICSSAKQKNIEQLKEEIQRVKPTIMQATPATWTALFLIGWRNEERVKILCGGEALPERLKSYFVESDSEVWNMFGPTETTIWSTVKEIKESEPITIGKPIANTQIYILNKEMKAVPLGVPGELFIGGDGLARGYLNRADLTAERFIANPFKEGTKLYRTGDLARWLASGDIEFLGRIDNQVKLNGFRIELDEIETRLNMFTGVRESAVVIVDHNGNKQMRAFYVCKEQDTGGKGLDVKEMRAYLKKWLPAYMIPSVFTELSSIPLTPNGKVNRLELAKHKGTKTEKIDGAPMAKSETESIILEIWKEVIGIDEIALDDGFFEVGGDSITAVIAAERMSARLNCELKVTTIFEHSNIREISKYVLEQKGQDSIAVEESKGEPEVEFTLDSELQREKQSSVYPDYYEDSIAIIGISSQFPGAETHREFWQNLRDRKESVRHLSREELEKLNVPEEIAADPNYVAIQLQIEGKDLFDPEFFKISPKDAEFMDPQMRLLLLNAWKAVEDAGYISRDIPNTAVFMSSSNNFYQAPEESKNLNILESSDGYVTWLLGQGGTIPTMVSYQLGFKGPSYSVHSNCSSSLVGLYSACQSLRSGEVEYALVGASTIHSATNAGYLHRPGLNFSSDGHLKAFDSSADGMIGGEGVAVIVLKSAKKAIEDRDNIYALLRGIDINNDGSDKVGFYAPSIKGQAEVINKVLQSTKINPETIGYVEAHGTGTKLGDPIEVTALSNIYKRYTMKKQFCGIGSVKTNIGHLDTAAGLAGCIKVALSLYNKEIPPTINFKEANREIDFSNSPFYVVDEPKSWQSDSHPYRAALSSFGIGGTNSHAIFESYESSTDTSTLSQANSKYLIPLSAKRDERLKEYGAELLSFLKSEDGCDMALNNIAYTLQVGREVMDSRVIFVVSDKSELINKLEAYIAGKGKIDNCYEKELNHPAEAIRLFEKDEDSKELIRKWITKGKVDKLAILWSKGEYIDWSLLYEERDKPCRVSLPTYPFAKERYWKSESVGVKSGVVRGKEVVQRLHPLIERNTSDFSEQRYTTGLSGDEYFLVDHVINNRKVLPGVVYIEMGRGAAELTINKKINKVKNVIWSRPITVEKPREVDIVLYPQGDEIEFKVMTGESEERVIHAQGKVEYLDSPVDSDNKREPVEGIDVEACIDRCNGYISYSDFYESNGSAVYQYGTTFRPIKGIYYNEMEAISHIELPAEREGDFSQFTLHPSLLEGCLQTVVGLMKTREVTPFMPFSIGEIEIIERLPKECYVYATLADGEGQRGGATRFNMKLVDPDGRVLADIKNYSIRAITADVERESAKGGGLANLYYKSFWKRAPITKSSGEVPGSLLIFCDERQSDEALQLGDKNIMVKPGEGFKEDNDYSYELNPGRKDDYLKLFATLKEKGLLPEGIIHMWTGESLGEESDIQMERGIFSLFYLTKALLEFSSGKYIKLISISRDERSLSKVLYGAISGFVKTVRIEQPGFIFKNIQLEAGAAALDDVVRAELKSAEGDEIRYTKEGRFVKELEEARVEAETAGKPMPFRDRGVYLITGGMGGLGLILARHLAVNLQARLVLIGRSKLDEKRERVIKELESCGAEVLYLDGDVSVKEDVEGFITETVSRFNELHGIIHCAGAINDSLIVNKSYDDMAAVLSPKVKGTILLDEASSKQALDLFILFSSVSHLGNAGQADYAYANSFLNYYADYREELGKENRRSGKSVSINWPLWEDGGMQINKETMKLLKTIKGIYPLATEAGLEALEKSALQKDSQITIFYGDPLKIRQGNEQRKVEALPKKEAPERQQVVKTDDKALLENVKNFLVKTASSLLKIGQIDIDRDMEHYGFDSISNTEFTNEINSQYKLDVMPTVFFELEQPTIASLANHLCEKYADTLGEFYQKATPLKSKSKMRGSSEVKSVTSLSTSIADRFQGAISLSPGRGDGDLKRESGAVEPVAIIGMDGIFPQSENLEEFWEGLKAERELVTEIPEDRFDWKAFNDPMIRWGGFMKEVDKFDAAFFDIPALEAEVMDPQHRLFLQVAWRAIEDAGYKPSDLSGSKTGIFVGIGTQDYSHLIDKHLVGHNPYALTGRTPFMLVNRISSLLNLHGPSEPVDTACSSSLVAVHKAVEAIQSGVCSMAMAGGVNVILNPAVHLSFSAAGMLTNTGKCKVFDKDANGTLRSEGVGAILLKRASDAIADGDHIYALIKGSAENHKGKSASLTAPNPNAQADLLVEVYNKAKVDPATISYIETHSTGTKLGDPIEITGLKKAFSRLYAEHGVSSAEAHCAIGSLKTNIGHLEAAAGIGALLKVLLSLREKTLPGTLHFKEANPYIKLEDSPFYVVTNTRPWEPLGENIPRRAGVSAFGFGGVNAHVMVEEYVEKAENRGNISITEDNPAIILFSAKKIGPLREQVKLLLEAVEKGRFKDEDLVKVAYTLQVGRESMDERLALTAVSIDELKDKLTEFLESDGAIGSSFYRGQVKRGNDMVSLLARDEGMDDLIELWIAKGEYNKLLSFWVKGLDFDWNRLYREGTPGRISLPAYPFERTRYWLAIDEESKVAEIDRAVSNSSVKEIIFNLLSDLLRVDRAEIDLDQPVAELGMDSIVLTQLLQLLQTVDPSIDFEMLYNCKTINEIIGVISLPAEPVKEESKTQEIKRLLATQSETLISEYPELIRLNKDNKKRPVFWFHGGFGGVEVYRIVAQKIERPFYGIQARGYMTDREPLEGMEAMASYYVRIIKSVQPEGPYDLGGLSLGGMVAYEVARQLQEMGDRVNSIVMLESIYVNEEMKNDWLSLPTLNLKKDRMLRAVNLLLAFSGSEELVLISESELNLEVDDEAFLKQLVELAGKKGSSKSPNQLAKSIVQLEKILYALDMSTTVYDVLPLAAPESVQCYYFCNPMGSLFGEDESYFRLVDKGRSYNFRSFADRWKEKMPALKALKVAASNHLTLLTEPESQEVITGFCEKLYSEDRVGDEYLEPLLID